jgi:hypothetical protein
MIFNRRRDVLFAALGLWVVVSAVGLVFPSGLRAQYFLGSELTGPPAHTALDATFSALELSRRWRFKPPDAFSVQWSGFVLVDRAGLYTFTVNADDGSRLFVDRQAVIEESGQGPGIRSGQIQLDRGAHAVLFQYVQIGGAYHLEWLWAREGETLAPVPAWTLSPRSRGQSEVVVARWLIPIWWGLVASSSLLGFRLLLRSPYWARRRAHIDDPAEAGSHVGVVSHSWIGRRLSCLALFVALAAVQTWPLVSNPAHLSRNDNADAVLNEWILSWVAYQAPRDPLRLFDANIFHPDRHTLAYSEPLIVQSALGAPLAWLGASPVLAYNLVLIAGLALTGWAMALVVARWTGDWTAGIAAGVLVAFNAHTLTRLPHLQAQHAEFLPLALLSLDALLRAPRWASAIWLAVWFTLQALTSIYLLVFTAIALAVAVMVRPEDWLGHAFPRVAPKLALAAALVGVALLPFLLPFWRLQNAGFERSLDEVAWFSATVNDYWSTPSRLHDWIGTSVAGRTSLFPGVTALALAGLALLPRGHPLGDRRVRMCLAFGIVGVALSFGPIVPGYSFLYSILPPLQAIRGSARFGYLGLVAVAVVGGYGFAQLRQRLAGRTPLKRAASALVLLLVFFEPLAAPIAYQPFTAIPEIYRLIRSDEHAVVADLPFPPPDAIFRNAPYMLGSTLHFKPLLNGYSGFIPPSYVAHYTQLASFPGVESIQALRALGVTHVFVHLDRLSAEAVVNVARLPGLQQIAVEGPIVLYRVMPGK